MRKVVLKFVFSLSFLFLGSFPFFSLEFDSELLNLHWTLDFTIGRQIFNILPVENGKEIEDTFVLEMNGFLFHAYYKNRLFSRATLSLGFLKSPKFLWTDNPDFVHDSSEESLNRNLKLSEFDYQFYFPKIGSWFLNFLPFGGFSFVNLRNSEIYGLDSMNYFSLSGGIQYYEKLNSYFSHTYYISYSPIVYITGFHYNHTIHYMNYGGEFLFDSEPFSFKLFVVFRKVYEEFGDAVILSEEGYSLNATEIGFSFRLSL